MSSMRVKAQSNQEQYTSDNGSAFLRHIAHDEMQFIIVCSGFMMVLSIFSWLLQN